MNHKNAYPLTGVDQPPPGRLGNLVDIAKWRAERMADEVAFTFLTPGENRADSISYQELDDRIRGIAAALMAQGQSGDRVLIAQPPGIDYICSLFACLYAGFVAVPVYPLDVFRLRHTLPRLQAITRDADARILLTSSEALGGARGGTAEAVSEGGIEATVVSSLWGLGIQAVIRSDQVDRSLADAFRSPSVGDNDLAILQYTSGTTTAPRGVVLRHRHLVANARQIYGAYHVPDAVCVFWLPPYHDMGLVGGLLLPLYAGRLSVLMSPTSFVQEPLAWLQAISDYRGTTTASPNFGYELCSRKVRDESLASLDLSSLRVAISGAEPIRAATLRRFSERFAASGFRATAFTPAYGMAEATLAITGKPLDDLPRVSRFQAERLHATRGVAVPWSPMTADGPAPDPRSAADESAPGMAQGDAARAIEASAYVEVVSCGVPMDQTEVLIVSPESLEPLGQNRIGEIWVRGVAVSEAYWQRPELTLATFAARPCNSVAAISRDSVAANSNPQADAAQGDRNSGSDVAGIGDVATPERSGILTDGYLRTGDLGFIHEDELFVSGRLKDWIIIAGRNYFAHEIEAVVQAIDPALKVDGGVAFGIETGSDGDDAQAAGERLVVVQELLRPKKVNYATLVERIRATLAQHFDLNVATIVFVAAGSLSKTSSGKLQRAQCRDEFRRGELNELHRWDAADRGTTTAKTTAARTNDDAPSLAPLGVEPMAASTTRGSVAERLAPIWCEVLNLDSAADDQHFLDFGGHSLAAMALLSRIRERLGVIADFDTLFRAPRFGELTAELERLVLASDANVASATATASAPSPVAISQPSELTPSQRRFWLLDSLELRQAFLHVELSLRLEGSLDLDRLTRRIAELPDRHEGLRLRVTADENGVPHRRLADASGIEVRHFDWRDESPAGLDERLSDLRTGLTDERFDLASGPVFRAGLVQLPGDLTELILVAHHLVCDGASLRVLARDLALVPETASPPTADLDSHFRPIASELSAKFLQAGMEHWSERLRSAPTDSRLATPSAESPAAAEPKAGASRFRQVNLDAELISRLQQRSRQWGVTPFEILLSAWHLLLGRYTESEDVVIGVPIAGRDTAELENAVGCFINTLPVRLGIASSGTFAQWVARVSDHWRADLRHAAVPLDAIIDRLSPPERSADRLPLIQHLLLHQPPAPGGLRIGGANCVDFCSAYSTLGAYDTALVCQWRETSSEAVPSRIAMEAAAGSNRGIGLGRCELGIAYNPQRLDERFAAQMLDGLVALLRDGLNQPAAELAQLEISGAEERGRREAANRAEHFHDVHETVLDQFSRQVERTPDAIAVIDRQGPFTFADLELASNRLARVLRGRGVGPGSIVALSLSRGRGISISALATWKAGAAYLPLDPHYPAESIAQVLEDARPVCTLTDADVDQAICRGEGRGDLTAAPLPGATSSGLAYLIYTSGSTGKPKGVMIGHDNLSNVLKSFARRPGLRSGERILASTTMSFDISILELYLPLVTGATSLIAPHSLSDDPDAVLDWLHTYPADVIQATPSSLRMMLATGWSPRPGQTIWCGGEPLHADLAETLLASGAKLWNVYGPTETTVWSLAGELTRPLRSPISIGHPIDSTTVRIVDTQGRDVPEGLAGELWIGGFGVGRGYWQKPETTDRRFVTTDGGERVYRTGDRVRRLCDGSLTFLGRSDRQIKLRGHRIELGEIEAAMLRFEGVREAAVTVVDHSPTDRRLIGFYQADQQATLTPAGLRQFLESRLAAAKIPALLVPLAAIPHTPAGKVDYRQLPSAQPLAISAAVNPEPSAAANDALAGLAGLAGPLDRQPPATPTERHLARIWQEVLGGVEPSRDDHFFQVGGHSLMAAQVFARIRTRLGVHLPLREIYSHPTLRELAAKVDSCLGDSRPATDADRQVVTNTYHADSTTTTTFESPAGLAAYLRRTHGDMSTPDASPPLSPAEQRLWFVDQLEPNHPFYNLPLAARIDGPLDQELLWRCVDACVARHETLRSTYELIDGQPLRRILPTLSIPRTSVDLRTHADAEAELQAQIAHHSRLPFDLAQGPLLRVLHWRLADQQHVILLVMHHIVSDGWSMAVMMGELAELYRQAAAGEPFELRPLEVHYREYAAWQQEALTPERIEPAIEFWQQALDGAVETLDLPVDFPRPAVQDFHGATCEFSLPPATSAAVRNLAQSLQVTPYSVLLTAYGSLLSRWSGQRDLTIGTAVANRTEPMLEALIGFFVNTVMIRHQAEGSETFAELVRETHRRATEAIAHQEVPFERVVGRLAKRRDRSHSPLFQAAFVLQNAPHSLVAADGLTITPMSVDNGTAKFDMTLLLGERDGVYRGHFEYRSSLFLAESIARMATSLQTLLTAALEDSGTAVDALPLVTPAEAEAILSRSVGPRSETTPGETTPAETLTSAFAQAVARTPVATAIRHGERSIRYADLDGYAAQISRGLQLAGVRSGGGDRPADRVLVYLPRSIDQIAASIAAMRAGAAFVPVDTQVPLARLIAIVGDLEPAAIIAPAGRLAEIRAALAESAQPEIVCRSAAELAAADDGQRLPTEVSPHDLAYLIFTSGSTGVPKGIPIEHRAISNFIAEFTRVLEIRPGMRCGHLFSPSFDGALGDIYPALASGGCIEILDQDVVIDPQRLARELTRRQVETVALTPATLAILDPARLPHVRQILSAGAPLSGDLAARWLPTHALYNGYGPTECAVGVAIKRMEPGDLAFPAVGRPLANTSIYVLDPHGRLVPDGVIGEVHIGGRGVSRGYWRRPDLDRTAFLVDPFYPRGDEPTDRPRMHRTGDLGRWSQDGQLEIVGRRDEQIKLRGFRIEPAEIAAAIESLPDVAQAVVIADGDDSAVDGAGRRLIAYVVPNRDAKSDAVARGESSAPSQDAAESEQVDNWRRLFDESQRGGPVVLDPVNHFAGWTSVITGRPIPTDQMRHWADAAARRIRALTPRRVLEIGCGTGLILLRIADAVESYVGVDLLDSALGQLRKTLATRPELAKKVTLACREADDLGDLPEGGFDTIVLNSIVQYFPSEEYLLRVLQGAQRLLAPGGRIFLGDLRNLRLQRAFAIAVELERRGDEPLTVAQFESRVRNRVAHDEELLVDPDLQTLFAPRLDRLREVRTLVKTARGDNELNRFRFDAVLAFDSPATQLRHDWARRRGNRTARSGNSARIVANAQVQREVAIDRRLAESSPSRLFQELLEEVDASRSPSIKPWSLVERAARKGLSLRVDWCPDADDAIVVETVNGSSKRSPGGLLRELGLTARAARPDYSLPPGNSVPTGDHPSRTAPRAFTNRPLVRRENLNLIPRIRRELQDRLPAYMVPAAYVLIDELPLTLQGKLDRAALPAPPPQRNAGEHEVRPPRTASQRLLVEVWEELLEVTPIGIDDDFFELGGHSMLAVRMVSEVQQRTGQTLPLAALFRSPTIERLAECLDHPEAVAASTLIPLAIGGSGAPLFCIHPAGGTVFCYRELADAFAGGRPVFGVQARGLDGLQAPHTTATEMAADYASAIQTAAPSGPIHLLGWSLGGNIAYEVARHLRSSGREIGLLALLDSGLISGQRELSEADFLPLIAALFPGQKAESLEQLRQKSPLEQLEYFVRQAAIAGIVPDDPAVVGPHIFDVFQANIRAIHEHEPLPFDGAMLLVRPGDQLKTGALFDDETLGWSRLVQDVRVENVTGDHAHMLQQPAVTQIAALVQACLTPQTARPAPTDRAVRMVCAT